LQSAYSSLTYLSTRSESPRHSSVSLGQRQSRRSSARLIRPLMSGLTPCQTTVRPAMTSYWTCLILILVRWDPKREDPTFFFQSASIWSAYYQLQILVHRPFVHQSGTPSSMALSSLAICTNAARACSRVIEAHQQREGGASPHQIVRPCHLFGSGVRLSIHPSLLHSHRLPFFSLTCRAAGG
jgi:hypothetical protein